MKRFVEGVDRTPALLLPDRLEDYVHQDNPVRLVDAFVDALNLASLGFEAASRAAGGRPAYHPAALLKIYIYGYLNRVQSSRWLERKAQRNLEVIWLTRVGWRPTSRRSPTSARTTAPRLWRCAVASPRCAAG